MYFDKPFDVIVVGGGHAGTEAALASARMGRRTLLLTHNIETLGQMSCNPSIGGIGKGHLVKEVDALGGAMAIATDEAGIQFRTLNSSKGPAVRATRAQADRLLYKQAIRHRLETQPNLTLFQQAVDDLTIDESGGAPRVTGVVTQIGLIFEADAVVLTTGTFLSGLIHVGLRKLRSGTRRRSARKAARRKAARTATAGRPTQDRNAAAHRRPHDRFLVARNAARRCSRRRCSRSSARATCIRASCRAGSRTRTRARTRSFARGLIARRCSPA